MKLTAPTGLSVGGAAGVNQNYIENITGKGNFEKFSNYRYVGGIAGENRVGAEIINSSYAGAMTESSGLPRAIATAGSPELMPERFQLARQKISR